MEINRLHNMRKSFNKHFDDFLTQIRAVWKARQRPSPVTDDSARTDGGKTTEQQPVSAQKMKDLGHTAIDHTQEEPGS